MSRYADSGVDITAGARAVSEMTSAVQSTYGPQVLSSVGSFGGLFDASAFKGMEAPVLVASTDGVGTKVMLAEQYGRFGSIGEDLVNHCINDILVQGARPLFFMDYVATSALDPARIARIVQGMARACRAAGCALLGGETAEMPGVYAPGQFDVAGTIVGVVERAALLPRGVAAGDLLVGLASSGPHTNGYSLIRRVFAEVDLATVYEDIGVPLGDALLAPHRSYLGLPLTRVKALAHLTGGGFVENLPRVLPERVRAVVWRGKWPVPPLFARIASMGEVPSEEMHRVFNMGIGMVAVVAPSQLEAFRREAGEETWVIGELVPGERGVELA